MMPRPVLFVVDDEPVVGAIVKRLADPAGFDVVVCESAAEAIARMSERPADIAFVDLLMPETNGIDLLRQIRDTLPACEVVLMSGRATIESRPLDWFARRVNARDEEQIVNDSRQPFAFGNGGFDHFAILVRGAITR